MTFGALGSMSSPSVAGVVPLPMEIAARSPLDWRIAFHAQPALASLPPILTMMGGEVLARLLLPARPRFLHPLRLPLATHGTAALVSAVAIGSAVFDDGRRPDAFRIGPRAGRVMAGQRMAQPHLLLCHEQMHGGERTHATAFRRDGRSYCRRRPRTISDTFVLLV